MRRVARGDFDGDGVEDMLLSSSDAARGGSYRAVRMFVLTRRQPDGKVELVRELSTRDAEPVSSVGLACSRRPTSMTGCVI